jgi:hypothetical protein
LHVNKDSAITPRQRNRKCDPDPAAADFSFDLEKEDISSETNMSLEEEEKPIKESDGLEDYWKDFALAVESSKVCSVNCKFFYFFWQLFKCLVLVPIDFGFVYEYTLYCSFQIFHTALRKVQQ